MPFALLPFSFWRFLQLAGRSFFVIDDAHRLRYSFRRTVVMLVFLPLFAAVYLIHWLGFFMDELLYRGYRKVEIKGPVFVVGVPRSGTTFLHRVMARDAQFTTFATWECLFAPSITQRKIWLTLAALDHKVGSPLQRLLRWFEKNAFKDMDGVHKVRFDAAEEDYLTLLPIMYCFILILPFPLSNQIWQIGRFDHSVPLRQRKLVMRYYRACLQKHLYVHGPEKILLSKNASFAPLVGSLCDEFPDARFIACMRPPLEALPSQLSAIIDGIRTFANGPSMHFYRERILDVFPSYYHNLLTVLPRCARGRHVFVNMADLNSQLSTRVEALYSKLGLPIRAVFRTILAAEDAKSRGYVTQHRYSPVSVGLDSSEMQRIFSDVYARYDFTAGTRINQRSAY